MNWLNHGIELLNFVLLILPWRWYGRVKCLWDEIIGRYNFSWIFLEIVSVCFESSLFLHLMHSKPWFFPFDFILLLHFWQSGFVFLYFFTKFRTWINSTLSVLGKCLVALRIPPPILTLSPTSNSKIWVVIPDSLYTAQGIVLFFVEIEKNTWPPYFTSGLWKIVPVIVPEVYGSRFWMSNVFCKWSASSETTIFLWCFA